MAATLKALWAHFPLHVYEDLHQSQSKPPPKPILWIHGPGPRPGWPSFDSECLKWQMYLLFRGVDFDIQHVNEPEAAPEGRLPALLLPSLPPNLIPASSISSWLEDTHPLPESRKPQLDGYRSDNERVESRAWISLAERKLHAAVLVQLFHIPTSDFITRLYYPLSPTPSTAFTHAARPPFPTSLLQSHLARQHRQRGTLDVARLSSKGIVPPTTWSLSSVLGRLTVRAQDLSLDVDDVEAEAEEALEAIALRLGEDEWMLGSSHPTALDSVLFAYLHTILSLLPASSPLRLATNKHANLGAYARRVYDGWIKGRGSQP